MRHQTTEADHHTLWSTLSRIPAHPDTAVALGRLRSHCRFAIISNTDDELIAGTVKTLGTPVDFVVNAQQVGPLGRTTDRSSMRMPQWA